MAARDDSRIIPPLAPISRRDRRSQTKGVPHGRYDGRSSNTRLPPGGDLGKPPKHATASRNVDTTIAAITDPMGDGEQRILATVNRHTDLLEHERSHKLISEAAYRNGRIVQGIIEKAGRIGGSNWAGASRRDAAEVRDGHAQRVIDDGRIAEAWRQRIRDRLGIIDARLIDKVLGDGMSYADCAARVGRAGERGQRYMASRFRDALEELSEVLTAKGRVVPPPEDKHRAAAEVATTRQALALAEGATLERLEAELSDLVGRKVKTLDVRRDIAWLQERVIAVRQAKAGFGPNNNDETTT